MNLRLKSLKNLHAFRTFGLVLLALALSACTSGTPTAVPTQEIVDTGNSEVTDYASFVAALEASGADVEAAGTVQPGFFDLEAQIVKLNGQDVQVMEFADEAAAQAAASTISADGTEIGTSIIRWMDTPHFFTQGRLIVLYVGSDAGVVNQLAQVLGPSITG